MPTPVSFVSSFAFGTLSSFGGELLGGPQRAIAQAGNIQKPNMIPSWPNLCYLFSIGAIDIDTFQDYGKRIGFDPRSEMEGIPPLTKIGENGKCVYNDILSSLGTTLAAKDQIYSKTFVGLGDVFTLYNRELIDEDLAHKFIRFQVGGEIALASQYLKLKDDIPSVGTIANYATANLFDPVAIKLFGLDQEMHDAIPQWAKLNGEAGLTGVKIPSWTDSAGQPQGELELTWAHMAGMINRTLPSSNQVMEMFHRYYATSQFGKSPLNGNDVGVTEDQVKAFMQKDGIPPKWRDWLIGINFNPLSLRYIKMLYANNILKEDASNHEVFHAFRQIGYDDTNANRMKDLVLKTARKDIVNLSIKQIDNLYLVGAITSVAANALLVKLDYTVQDANAHIDLLDGQLQLDELKRSLVAIKRLYFDGEFSVDDIRGRLTSMGVTDIAIDRYIRIWSLQLRTERKYISLEKSISLYKKGYINVTQLTSKLTNLKYTQPEINVLILEANNDIQIAQLKGAETLAKANKKIADTNQRAIDKAIKSKQKAISDATKSATKAEIKAHSQALKAYTDANMKKWYSKGLLSESFIIGILEQRGWEPDAINDWMEVNLVEQPKGANNATQTQKP